MSPDSSGPGQCGIDTNANDASQSVVEHVGYVRSPDRKEILNCFKDDSGRNDRNYLFPEGPVAFEHEDIDAERHKNQDVLDNLAKAKDAVYRKRTLERNQIELSPGGRRVVPERELEKDQPDRLISYFARSDDLMLGTFGPVEG
jgi:hypothetical protein